MQSSDIDPRLTRLNELVDRVARRGLAALDDRELVELPRLYRYAASRLALYQTQGRDAEVIARTEVLTSRAHAVLHQGIGRSRDPLLPRILAFYVDEVPRAIRGEWRLIGASFLLMYGLAGISWFAVSRDLDLAFSLLDPNAVAGEIAQLQSTPAGEAFKGNFTFGLGQSPSTAGWIMAHNMWVSVVFFASALVPPVYVLLLATNGLMLGTYTGVAGHWGQAGSISSILWCHGTLEIQAIVLSGAAGLVLVRGLIAPGARTRGFAMRVEAARSWRLLAAMFPMLFCAGLIEGFISPHANFATRITVAVTTGLALVAWLALGGRGERTGATAARAR